MIQISFSSPPPSLPGSQPHTREASPCPMFSGGGFNARTPPPKRWKRSFDMTQPPKETDQPLPLVKSCIHRLSTNYYFILTNMEQNVASEAERFFKFQIQI
jgi:hypothetical protein